MAKYVREVMNKDLFWTRRETAATAVLDALIGLGIGGAPVVELDGRPAGWVSLRDVAGDPSQRPTAAERMTSPAQTIGADARVEDAAHTIAATGRKHLVVLDDTGHAVGVVSAIDVLRELIGLPVPHPATFGHVDGATGLAFTDDLVFEEESIPTAPDGPGVLMLVHALCERANAALRAAQHPAVAAARGDPRGAPTSPHPRRSRALAGGRERSAPTHAARRATTARVTADLRQTPIQAARPRANPTAATAMASAGPGTRLVTTSSPA